MPEPTLSRDALNRATLARQMLLRREKATPLRALERLAGLQAQLARPPYVGLWSRLQSFEAESLTRLVVGRKAVRATLMRGTLHLVSAKDYRLLRPLLQPMLGAAMAAVLEDRTKGIDLEAVTEEARRCLEDRPCTFEELRGQLAAAFPGRDVRAMGYAVRTHLPLVQVPDGSRWGYPGAAAFATASSWLGEDRAPAGGLGALVKRYLAAFGPATVKDAETWSYLGGLRETFEALRPRLRVFWDEKGRELFDLPDAPRPSPKVPTPVRFLPDYDNLLLSHHDRSRVIDERHRRRVATANLRILPTFLVDGYVRGTWEVERARGTAALVLTPFEPVGRAARAALQEEGQRLARFVEPEVASVVVRFAT